MSWTLQTLVGATCLLAAEPDAVPRPPVVTIRSPRFVMTAAVSPDGNLLATSGGLDDDSVRLWDMATGKLAGTLEQSGVESVTFGPGAKHLLALGRSAGALWDIETRQLALPTWTHPPGMKSGSFSPDGKRLFVARSHGNCELLDLSTGKPVRDTQLSAYYVTSVAYSPDGKQVLATQRSHFKSTERVPGKTYLWHADSLKPICPPLPGEMAMFSPDGKTLAIAVRATETGYCREIALWDAGTGKQLTATRKVSEFPNVMAYGAQGDSLFAAYGGRTVGGIHVIDTTRFTAEPTRLDNERGVVTIASSPSGDLLLCGNGPYGMPTKLWHVRTSKELARFKPSHWVGFSPDGKKILVAHKGEVGIWKTADFEE